MACIFALPKTSRLVVKEGSPIVNLKLLEKKKKKVLVTKQRERRKTTWEATMRAMSSIYECKKSIESNLKKMIGKQTSFSKGEEGAMLLQKRFTTYKA